ncbi:MAG: hypothetical protein F4123_07400 [Gemmatimonadetes bacterium]|nr:hypothetical protein [Gemmatimonadota bacterium]MYB98339.1 hypothetical protein [Gemmatimonadota bacterium]MYI46182.1 hypothetical protein [Gemmatimonadota bacterium]
MRLHRRRQPGEPTHPPETGPPDGRAYAALGGKVPRLPIVSMILMAVFLVGGSIGLLVDWPAGPANLDWGVWVVLYGGYGFVISAALFHARTGR